MHTKYFLLLVFAAWPFAASAQSDLMDSDPFAAYENVSTFCNGLATASKTDANGDVKWGVVDEEGKAIVPFSYDGIQFLKEGSGFKDNVYKCKQGRLYGIISSKGITLLPMHYSYISLQNDMLRLSDNGKYGYAKLSGTQSANIVIACLYKKLGTYSATDPMRATLDDKQGLIDANGKTVIPFNFSYIGQFSAGDSPDTRIAWVRTDSTYGIYSLSGMQLQPCDISAAFTSGTDGMLSAMSFKTPPATTGSYIYTLRSGKTGLVSGKDFHTLLPSVFDYLSPIVDGRMFFLQNGKWGIVDEENHIVQKPMYDKVVISGALLTESTMPKDIFRTTAYVCATKKWGMLTREGNDLVAVRYDSLGNFSDSMLLVKSGNLYGYVNADGKEVIPCTYSRADDFSEGLAAVRNEKGKTLFIDRTGEVVIKPHDFDYVWKFEDGTCRVSHKNKLWEIDRKGKRVKDSKRDFTAADAPHPATLPAAALYPADCTNTLRIYAAVAKSIEAEDEPETGLSEQFCQNIGNYEHVLGNFYDGLLPVVKNRLLGYINAKGEEVIPCSLKYYIEPGIEDTPVYGAFHEGLARVSTFDGTSGSENYNGAENIRYGYIDKTGRLVIPYIFTTANDFSEGKAYVVLGDDSFRGFIDKTGKRLFSVSSSAFVESFSDGLARASDYVTRENFFLDENGKKSLVFSYDVSVNDFHDELAFYNDNTWKGFIDKSGNHVIDCKDYSVVHDFSEGLAAVSKDGQVYGFIDTKGNVTIPISYEGMPDEGDTYYFSDFHDGVFRIFKDGKYCFFNKNNELVLETEGDKFVSDMSEGFALVNDYDMKRNISHYSILTKQGFSTTSYTDDAVSSERTATLLRQQEENRQAFDELQAQRERESELYRQREEEKRRAEAPTRFTSYSDAVRYIYPSMKFYGRGSWFKGTLEIRASNDKILTIYANGFLLGTLLNRGAQYKSVDVKDNMVRFFIQDSEREYPLVIHMPDKEESKPYIYFEPVATRDFRGDFDIRYRNEKGWEWFEPVVDNESASMMFHPTREEPVIVHYVQQ